MEEVYLTTNIMANPIFICAYPLSASHFALIHKTHISLCEWLGQGEE